MVDAKTSTRAQDSPSRSCRSTAIGSPLRVSIRRAFARSTTSQTVPICNKDDLLALRAPAEVKQYPVHGGGPASPDDGELEFRHLGHHFRHAHGRVAQAAGALLVPRALVGGPASRHAA